MTIAERKSKTLALQDLDLDVTYQGDLISELFNPDHSYKVIQRTEDAYLQPCSMCERERQARYRVTIVNLTTGATFHTGRKCLLAFGVTYDELDKSTVLLALLARAWQAYKHRSGEKADFPSTREAVVDLHRYLLSVAKHNRKLFEGAAEAVERILGDLAHINDYRPEVYALRNLIGLVHDTLYKPEVLNDRIAAWRHHPLLTPDERSAGVEVLRAGSVSWPQVKAFGEKLDAINGKTVPVKVKQVPAWKFASEAAYHEELRAYAEARLQRLNEQNTTLIRPDKFHEVMRKRTYNLPHKGGFYELVFESPRFAILERLVLPKSLQRAVEEAGGVFLMAAQPTSYLRYLRTITTHHSADAMMRAAQREGEHDDGSAAREVQERFYRAAILYLPDPYVPSYEFWVRHGGVKDGRKHLEDLTSELLSGSSSDE